MEFALSEDQIMLQASVRKALASLIDVAALRDCVDKHRPRHETVWQSVVDLGIPALLVPEQYGGIGLSMLDAALVAEEMGRACTPSPFTGSCVLSTLALTHSGSDAQKQQWLTKMAAGESSVGFAFTEVVSGYRVTEPLQQQNGSLNGTTLFVLDGQGADAYIVACEEQLWLVEANANGLTSTSQHTIDGSRPTLELTFDNTPAQCLPNANRASIEQLLNAAWIMQAADTLGAAWKMIDDAVAYTQVRRQFGRLIGSFQAVKHLCAEMAAEIEPGRSLVWYAAHAFDNAPEEATLYACHAKALLSDAGQIVARKSIEVHGGIGITDDLGLHYWAKRIGQNRMLLGSPQDARQRALQHQI